MEYKRVLKGIPGLPGKPFSTKNIIANKIGLNGNDIFQWKHLTGKSLQTLLK